MSTTMIQTNTPLTQLPARQAPGRARGLRRAGAPIALALVAALLGGCVSDGQYGQKQGFGTLIGAGLGGLVGSKIGGGRGQLAAVAAGALLGGLMGNEIGASLDRADMAYQSRAQGAALNGADWAPVAWSNPDSGNYGEVTPTRTLRNGRTGQVCREYRTTVTIGGRVEEGYGTACRDGAGDWRIQS